MDDLRRFCDLNGGYALTDFSTDEGMGRVRTIFPYAMGDRPVAKGYAAFKLLPMPTLLDLPQGKIYSTLLPHGAISTLGLVFEERSSGKKFVYYNDCKRVPPEAIALAKGADVVVLDALRPEQHASHMNIEEACAAAAEIGCPVTYLTHMTHHVAYGTLSQKLPLGVQLAYDGLRLKL